MDIHSDLRSHIDESGRHLLVDINSAILENTAYLSPKIRAASASDRYPISYARQEPRAAGIVGGGQL